MRTFTIKTSGLEKVLRNMDRYGKAVHKVVDEELNRAAQNVASEARANSSGSVAASIYTNTSQKFRKSVGNSNPIAAYYEFGTGQFVFKGAYTFTVPEKQFAKLFYVSGKGTLKSHAALFPAFKREIPRMLARIDNKLYGI